MNSKFRLRTVHEQYLLRFISVEKKKKKKKSPAERQNALSKRTLSSLSSFSSWKIKHMKRDYNRASHELAQYARQKEVSQI